MNQKVEVVEIGQQLVTPPFDNLQRGKGEWFRIKC
jgi:hypothetical protein